MRRLWAVVPVKDIDAAKQRLAGVLDANVRRALALAMLEDVLDTLTGVRELRGIVVATADPRAAALAARFGAVVSRVDAADGHSEAVAAAAHALAQDGAAMLTIPADIPLVQPDDIAQIIAAGKGAGSFVIVPARDGRGSNAVLCAPADRRAACASAAPASGPISRRRARAASIR